MCAGPVAYLDAIAAERAAAKEQAIVAEQERMRRANAVDDAFGDLLPTSENKDDYRAWARRLVAFCDVAKREGYADRFNDPKTTDTALLDAHSLIAAGLSGGETAVGERLREIVEVRPIGAWQAKFNCDFFSFLVALQQVPALPVPMDSDNVVGGESENAAQSVVSRQAVGTDHLSDQGRALALLVEHPDWTDVKIAKSIGVSRTTLYKPTWKQYQDARKAIAAGKHEQRRGHLDRNGNLEACDE